MRRRSYLGAAVLAAVATASTGAAAGDAERDGAAGSLKQTYEQQWRDTPHVGITRALSPRQLRQCAAYRYKRNTAKPHQYLVRCTDDGRRWRTFLVDTESGQAMGPYEPAPVYD